MRWLDGITDDGHEFEQTLGDGEGQGSLACCNPWGRKELDMTEQLNNNKCSSIFRNMNGSWSPEVWIRLPM